MASYAENVSISWRHHVQSVFNISVGLYPPSNSHLRDCAFIVGGVGTISFKLLSLAWYPLRKTNNTESVSRYDVIICYGISQSDVMIPTTIRHGMGFHTKWVICERHLQLSLLYVVGRSIPEATTQQMHVCRKYRPLILESLKHKSYWISWNIFWVSMGGPFLACGLVTCYQLVYKLSALSKLHT